MISKGTNLVSFAIFNASSNINEVIKTVLNFLLILFTKIFYTHKNAQKVQKKHKAHKAQKAQKALKA